MNASRRRFLQSTVGSSLVVGLDAAAPRCLVQAATQLTGRQDTVLVVVQLSGGNDGLNTVIPIADDEYRKARPNLAIPNSEAIRIDDQTALHPSLKGITALLEEGKFCVVHGVGYEQPNRSHFESMDIWHTCRRKEQTRSTGWIGRFLDASGNVQGGDVPALHFGNEKQPLALAARNVRVPSVKSIDEFRLKDAGSQNFQETIEQLTKIRRDSEMQANDLLSFVQSSTASALVASEQVNEARKSYQSSVSYPDSALGRKLEVVAQLIDAELATRIYYVELDGFDTHAAQAETHAILLREWGDAVSAFIRDVSQHGHEQRVNLMTFSEFGRRVAENASGGTDHGAAAPMYFAGGALQQAVVGSQPNLVDLQDGDLKFAIDFRQVYASVLTHWLGAEAQPIVGGEYASLPIFSNPA